MNQAKPQPRKSSNTSITHIIASMKIDPIARERRMLLANKFGHTLESWDSMPYTIQEQYMEKLNADKSC
jgi:hypothetical protein